MERKLGNFEVINSLMMMSIADIVLTSAGILIKDVKRKTQETLMKNAISLKKLLII